MIQSLMSARKQQNQTPNVSIKTELMTRWILQPIKNYYNINICLYIKYTTYIKV